MTIEEVAEQIKRYEKQVMGKEIGDASHKIQGFAISQISANNYELHVLGQNLRSYTNFIQKPLVDWLSENEL